MTASDFLAILGRLHPLVLHLPIGLLVGLGAVETASLLRRRDPGQGLGVLVWLNAAAGVAAATSGFLLSREPGYAGGDAAATWRTIDTHMWLGISVGVLSVLLAAAHARRLRRPGTASAWRYRAVLAFALALLLPTGHLGGEMTHGEGFVLEPLRSRSRPEPIPLSPSAETASPLKIPVHPLLTTYCISCHGENRQKGGLALHTPAAIAAGGDSGPVIVPGDPAASELLRRLRLPADHDDRMPPTSKRQPSTAEIDSLADWLSAGTPSHNEPLPDERPLAASPPDRGPDRTGPDPASIQRVRAALVHVQPIQHGAPLLYIDFAAPASTGDIDDAAAADLLGPLVDHVADLSLAGSDVTDATLALLARMPHLRRLDLRGCGITDAGLAALASHASLKELNLVGTSVTDAAADSLLSMPALERVYTWKTSITPEGAARLRAREGLHVETGDLAPSSAIEVEPTPPLTSDAPLPGQESSEHEPAPHHPTSPSSSPP